MKSFKIDLTPKKRAATCFFGSSTTEAQLRWRRRNLLRLVFPQGKELFFVVGLVKYKNQHPRLEEVGKIMPYRRIFFEKNQQFHILSRAVAETKIFEQEEDCYRFIFHFWVANYGRRASNIRGKEIIKIGQALLQGEEISPKFIIEEHPPLVYLLDFSLVINHYHFYLLPNIENSVPLLIQKLNNGFAKYFNLKHNRRDALFGSRYKSILVGTELQSDAVSRYVSIINPLDVFQPGWREKGLKNLEDAFDFLKSYQFSSFPDKIGARKSKILAPSEILERYSILYKDKKEFQRYVEEFLQQKSISSQFFFLE